jgi:hypothetical protein
LKQVKFENVQAVVQRTEAIDHEVPRIISFQKALS